MDQRHANSIYRRSPSERLPLADFPRPAATTTLPHWQLPTTAQAYSNGPLPSGHDDASPTKSDQDNLSVHSGDHYDSYPSSRNRDEHITFPITPPEQLAEPQAKRPRTSVPEEKKDNKYWARRTKNNKAAKRSRDTRKKRMDDEIKSAKEAIAENHKLKQEIDVLKSEINSLRRLLKDANMTLSLWIKARQASEPNSQLPPMLRGPNLSFVNFPVATTI